MEYRNRFSWDRRRLACTDTLQASSVTGGRDARGPGINRRNFLRGAKAASALLVSARPAFCRTFGAGFYSSSSQGLRPWLPSRDASGAADFIVDAQRRFAPVKVSCDRIIREVVGLRPYRC